MEKARVLVVCYGARGVALADTLKRSTNYAVELFIADKQRNPHNARIAKEHRVIPDLNVDEICRFAEKWRSDLDFALIGPENPIIEGIKDALEGRLKIPTICPSKSYALEGSKVKQRLLLEEILPEANPRFKVFSLEEEGGATILKKVERWIMELGGVEHVVIKPDKPGFGKGVGVGGEHFNTMREALSHFQSLLGDRLSEKVIVEEKVEGEESSFQAWCDGNVLVPMPDTRDYKRAYDGDMGPNTGGMGSYRNVEDHLPFMTSSDREKEVDIANKLLNHLKGEGHNPNLIGVPFYIAFIHTASTPKILEINSRPGDPEIMNILPTMETDLVDLCYDMVNGSLSQVKYRKEGSVVTYAVPMTYGGYRKTYSGDGRVDLTEAYRLSVESQGRLFIYPGSMEVRDGVMYALKSRAVAVVGVGESIEDARQTSLEGVRSIDGPLWNRWDIGSAKHIAHSIQHLRELRKGLRIA